jgi:hypothetical protein
LRLALSLALAAAPALFAAAPAVAQQRPVACVYYGMPKGDRPELVKVVRAGIVATNDGERVLVDKIRASADACRKRYGWGKKRMDAAMRYFAGRVLATDSTYHLRKYGFDYEKLKALIVALDAPTRQAYVAGNVTNEQSAATIEALKALGVDFAAVPVEERAMFGQKLSQGILGLVVEQEGEAAYSE